MNGENYSDEVKAALGFHQPTDGPLRPRHYGATLAAKAQQGDADATQLLSHEVLKLIPGFLSADELRELRAFIDANPERFPHNLELNHQAWHLPNEDRRFLTLLERARDAIKHYRESMAGEYFRQPLTYANYPGTHVGYMARTLQGYPHMLPHIHERVLINAVFYLHAPAPDQGGLVRFGGVAYDAAPGTPAQHPLTFICPPENALLIFPAYMVHGVTDYLGTEPRRSISMGM